MFDTQLLEEVQQLSRQRESFAVALVVNRQEPSSGKPGDRAIIRKDGKMTGWIGGGCTKGIILKEAADAMKDGKTRLVRISPDKDYEVQQGVVNYKMTCHSGGAVEVYIEPVLPKPELVILGRSHVGVALARIAKAMNYSVRVAAEGIEDANFPPIDHAENAKTISDLQVSFNTFIAVCTQGENDEVALEQAVKSGAPYVCFVASRKKANKVFQYLRQVGVPADDMRKIKTPAGLDINAKLPEEVAISILAEMISIFRNREEVYSPIKGVAGLNGEAFFINPVCNVPVEKKTAKHVIDYKEESYYFCCDGCKVKFEATPEAYVN